MCDWICVKLCACCVSTQGPLGAQHFGLHPRTPNLGGFQWGHLVWYCASKQEVGTWHEMEQSVCPFLPPYPPCCHLTLTSTDAVHNRTDTGSSKGVGRVLWAEEADERCWMGTKKGGRKESSVRWESREGGALSLSFHVIWLTWSSTPAPAKQFFYHFKFLWWANGLRYISWFVHGCKRCSSKEFTCPCRRCKRCGFGPCVRKIPWRRKWQPTPVFLSGEPHVLVL